MIERKTRRDGGDGTAAARLRSAVQPSLFSTGGGLRTALLIALGVWVAIAGFDPALCLAQDPASGAQPAAVGDPPPTPAPPAGPDAALPGTEPAAPAAERPLAPDAVTARDTPNDAGKGITVEWKAPAAKPGAPAVDAYEISRADGETNEFKKLDVAGAESRSYRDNNTKDGLIYRYRVTALSGAAASDPVESGPAKSSLQIFNGSRWNLLIISIIISGTMIFFIEYLRRGRTTFVRKIAGLEAVDEAIGRATEMGRPILFVPGIQDMNDIQTVAGITILGRIAKSIAEYDTKLEVPTSRALVMTTARETVKEAYMSAGRPDSYSDDMIYYLTDEQFGYVAGVSGIMMRKKPATCFYLGSFFAESLILAETGNAIGAIQIAGTAQPAQLPFFIAACDYTLIGEELFAASAYLSGEPKQLGSLKGQDMGKLIAMAAIVLGAAVATAATVTGNVSLIKTFAWFRELFSISG